MLNNPQLQVNFIFRKRNPLFFSIEKIFSQVMTLLKDRISISQTEVPNSRIRPWGILKNFLVLRKERADVFHVTGDAHYLSLAFASKKTVLTIHDCVFMYQGGKVKSLLLKLFFLKWPVKHAAIVTTISEKSRQEIIKYTACSPDKVIVIPNPVGKSFAYSAKKFNSQCPVILFLGSTPNKNLKGAIEAVKGINCILDIVGVIPADLQKLMEDEQIQYRQSAGISDAELVKKYTECDMVLFPSTYEGFGLPIIEAQQTGRPIVTSNISPLKEVAGEGACLVDPYSSQSIKEGILKIIQDDHYRNNLLNNGLINAQRYNPEQIANEYFLVYKRVRASSNQF